MGIFRFDRSGRIVAFEEKPKPDRLQEIGRSIPPARRSADTPGQAVHRLDGRLRLLARRAAGDAGGRQRQGLRPRGHPGGARSLQRQRVPVSRLLGRRRHRRVVLRREHHAHAAGGAVQVLRRQPARSTRTRASCRGRAWATAPCARRSSPTAASSIAARSSSRSSASGPHRARRDDPPLGAARRRLLRGSRRAGGRNGQPQLGIGADVVLDRVIVDKNARIGEGARLVNEKASITPTATATTSATASSSCRRTARSGRGPIVLMKPILKGPA